MSELGWGWGVWWVWAGISEILNRRHVFTTSLPSPCPPVRYHPPFAVSRKKSANLNFDHISESPMSNYDSADQNFVDENSAGQLFLLKIQAW